MRFYLAPLALLPLLAATQPVPADGDNPPDDECDAPETTTAAPHFTLTALRSGALGVHQQPVAATGGAFWIGKTTTTYCPEAAGAACASANNDTTAFGGDNGLDVGVPGGQQVYAAADGALSYTQAHSASTGTGAVVGEGAYTAPTDGASYGYWTYAGGLLACPSSGSGTSGQGPWKVYAQLEGKELPDCVGFQGAATTYDGPSAWQYS